MRAVRRVILPVALAASLLSSPAAQQPAPPGTGVIVGQVVDADGNRPVTGVVVKLTGPGVTRSALVESRGRFAFRDLPRGGYTLTAAKAGWAEGAYGRLRPRGTTQAIVLAEGERVGAISIRLWRLGALGGAVRDEHGDPFAGLEVRALLKTFRTGDARWVSESVTFTDDRGMYRFGSLTPGEYAVVIPSTSTATSAVEGYATNSVNVLGQVLTTGIPPAPGQQLGRPFIYRTTFYPNALTPSQATSIVLRPGEERSGVDFELAPVPTFTVSGVLTGPPPTGPRVSVELLRAAENVSRRFVPVSDIRVGMTQLDGAGQFMFLGVPAGQYVLRTIARGSAEMMPWAKQPVIVGDADVTNLVVPLSPPIVVSGRVEFEGQAPPAPDRLAQIPVSIEAIDPRDAATRIGRVTREGRFSAPGLPAGDYVIMAPGAPAGWMLKSVAIDGRDVTDRAIEITRDVPDVVLTFTDQITQLSGKVSTRTGVDAAASVVVFPGGGFQFTELSWTNGSRRFQLSRVDKDGGYVFNRLPAGSYFVAALPEEATDNWINAAFLTQLAATATSIQLAHGEKRTLDLVTLPVPR